MIKILKAESQYFLIPLGAMICLPLIFTVYIMSDIILFADVYFLKKYFWSMIIGLGGYMFMFIIWAIRKKESRDRYHHTFPLTLNHITFIRWVFGVIPFLLIGIYFEILANMVPERQIIFVNRASAQLGIFFIFLVSYDLVMNITILITNKFHKHSYTILLGAIIIIISASILFIYSMSESVLKPIPPLSQEIYFFVWGFVLSLVDLSAFKNRNNYLI